jgi:hypothetical protein
MQLLYHADAAANLKGGEVFTVALLKWQQRAEHCTAGKQKWQQHAEHCTAGNGSPGHENRLTHYCQRLVANKWMLHVGNTYERDE